LIFFASFFYQEKKEGHLHKVAKKTEKQPLFCFMSIASHRSIRFYQEKKLHTSQFPKSFNIKYKRVANIKS